MAEILLNLQRFAEGSAPAGDGASTGEGVASPATQGEEAASPTAEEERKAAYERFKNDFKAEYDAEMQSAIKDRLKKSKAQTSELQGRLDKIAPIMDALATKYGVSADDTDGMIQAFEADDKMYEEEAFDRGMTVDQVRAFHKLERENAQLKMAQERAREQAQYAEWDRQFEELQTVYPNVDPNQEMQNSNFVRLMQAGVPIRDVYELVHKEELTRGAMQFTANKVAEKMSNAALANSAHPQENVSGQAAAVINRNISSMSLEELKNYAQRAKAGESINFK